MRQGRSRKRTFSTLPDSLRGRRHEQTTGHAGLQVLNKRGPFPARQVGGVLRHGSARQDKPHPVAAHAEADHGGPGPLVRALHGQQLDVREARQPSRHHAGENCPRGLRLSLDAAGAASSPKWPRTTLEAPATRWNRRPWETRSTRWAIHSAPRISTRAPGARISVEKREGVACRRRQVGGISG